MHINIFMRLTSVASSSCLVTNAKSITNRKCKHFERNVKYFFLLFWWRYDSHITISSKRWKEKEEETERNKKSIDEKGVRTLLIRMQIVCNDFMKKKMTTAKEELQNSLYGWRIIFPLYLFQFTWVSQLVWLFKVLIMNFISFYMFRETRKEDNLYIFNVFFKYIYSTRSFILSCWFHEFHQARALKDWMVFGVDWWIWLSFSFQNPYSERLHASFLIFFIQWTR